MKRIQFKKTTLFFCTLIIVTFTVLSLKAENKISGNVSDDQNSLLSGVSVTVKNSSCKAKTDLKGYYIIEVDSLSKILVFNLKGFETKEIDIGYDKIINVTLARTNIPVEENKINTEVSIKGKSMIVAGGAQMVYDCSSIPPPFYGEFNIEDYSTIHESGFKSVANQSLSTFSIDVDNASYSNIRRFINRGQMPPKDAVRIEEMINYFHYSYKQPEKDHPFSVISEYSACPWNEKHNLLLVALQGKKIEKVNLPPSNIVFLLDVSGSMNSPNKLPLVKSAMRMLVEELRPQDKVSIVVYAGAAGLALEATPGTNKKKITDAIDNLNAGGSTAGGEGLLLAYKIAEENKFQGGNNRIILATDGDFNIGVSSDSEMERLVEKEREKGIFVTVLGFGMGNYKDNKLEIIADKGNGNYAYIDNLLEARKTLISEFGGTLFTIARDVKFQIEFNPQKVKAYRLIGYENRTLNAEDFNNDKKDAGEMGSGHQVSALYEIITIDSDTDIPQIDDLKYQKNNNTDIKDFKDELLTIKVRYKNTDADTSKLITQLVYDKKLNFNSSSENFKFTSSVVQFGMLLRDSEFKGNADISNTLELAKAGRGKDEDGYIGEFIRIVETAQSLGLK